MSAELQMSSSSDAVDFPYRAVSRAAIASMIFFVLALPGLIPTFSPLLILTAVGVAAGIVGLRATKQFPDEFGGGALAKFGLIANAALLLCGVSLHVYIYLTEVPEGYTRVPFQELQQPQSVPDSPTRFAYDIDGEKVFIKGYIHPASGGGALRQFILVPDLGTCCFGGQPKSSDMIEVTVAHGKNVKAGLTKRKLAGKFQLNRAPQKLTDFDNNIFYRLKADQVR
ncbi:hypothetical protein Pla52o_43450 [Novipirellula galeiformis]|uniref:DUF4190 domain-containing protein n=1 Tax=Novipirellula galeiformis TaxID=2528004 RepID=A0A5C6C8Z2_9BACT|nr:DUF3299 domain-containing protein [Novipirellula galeiformis]TWU20467.1 hypothetical protein Pla52o_43450 [Novipirellula galeiformis]